MVGVIYWALVISHYGASTQHGSVERSEISARDQYGDNQHVAYGLPPLEFHHTGGNDVLIAVFSASPTIDHRVQ